MLGHRSEKREIREGLHYNGKFTYVKHKAERSLYCTGKRWRCEGGGDALVSLILDLTSRERKRPERGEADVLPLLFDVV